MYKVHRVKVVMVALSITTVALAACTSTTAPTTTTTTQTTTLRYGQGMLKYLTCVKLRGQPRSCAGLVPASPALTDHIDLDVTRVLVGERVKGTLVILNKSRKAIDLLDHHGCMPSFVVVLTNRTYDPSVAFQLNCVKVPLVIRPGTNRFPISVLTTYLGCVVGKENSASTPPCTLDGPPPIPAGRYDAVLEGDGDLALPAPQPVTVSVVSRPRQS